MIVYSGTYRPRTDNATFIRLGDAYLYYWIDVLIAIRCGEELYTLISKYHSINSQLRVITSKMSHIKPKKYGKQEMEALRNAILANTVNKMVDEELFGEKK